MPVAPRHGGIPFFASSALLNQENLDVLMAIRSQRQGAAVHHVCNRLPKTEQEQKQQTFPYFFKLDFGCWFDRFRCQRYKEFARNRLKNITIVEPRSEVENGVSISPARADRGSGFTGNNKKRKIIARSGCRCFTEDHKKVTSKRSSLGKF